MSKKLDIPFGRPWITNEDRNAVNKDEIILTASRWSILWTRQSFQSSQTS